MKKEIPLFKVFMPKSVDEKIVKILHSGYIGQGLKVDEFEKRFAKFIKNPYALALNSGTSAMHLALRLANISYGDEVITTPMTCVGTNMPILAQGGKIIWADIDPITGNIDPKDIQKKITPKTKAIIMLHFAGNPCEIEEINLIAKKHNIKTIEDASHSLGSLYKGEKIGRHSDFVFFSLQAIKHITTVDGAMLFCKSKDDYKRGKLLRWFGVDRESKDSFRCEDNIPEYGYHFNMNDVNATIGLEQLKNLKTILTRYIENKNYYDTHLKDIKGITTIPKTKDSISTSWIYTIHTKKRDLLSTWLKKEGIATSRVHERNDLHKAFEEFKTPLPNLQKFNSTQLSIPVGWWVDDDDRAYIVDSIKRFASRYL